MIYSIPFVGWLIGAFFHVSLAVPFYFIWNALAPKFFYWLPPVYQVLGFWECAGLFIVLSILKVVLIPKLASVSQSTGDKDK